MLGFSLDGTSGGVYLFGTAGQLVDSVEYGPQVQDRIHRPYWQSVALARGPDTGNGQRSGRSAGFRAQLADKRMDGGSNRRRRLVRTV